MAFLLIVDMNVFSCMFVFSGFAVCLARLVVMFLCLPASSVHLPGIIEAAVE